MKSLLLILTALFLPFSVASSQILFENFEYPAGDPLTDHGWVAFSGGTTNELLVTSPGLTFPTYAGSGIGNATTCVNTGQDAYLALPVNPDTGNVYLSFMVNVITGRTGDYFTAFLSSTSTSNYTGRVYARLCDNGNIAFGLSKTTAGSGGIFYSDSVYSTGVTYLLLLKYDFEPGANDDQVSLFVFDSPPPMFEPSPTVGPVTGTGSDLPNIGRIPIRQGSASSSPDLILDGGYITNIYSNDVLPVELSSFTSTVNGRDVTLNWSTSSESNNSGFDVERASSAGVWSKVGFVNGNGTTSSANSYAFTDKVLTSGSYNYRLKQIDYNGNFEYFNLAGGVSIGVPDKFSISQNYPNPFNPSTSINFDVPVDSRISIKVYDISGKEAATVVNEFKVAGYYTVNFDAASLPSGAYFYTIEANGNSSSFTDVKKMMLIK